MAIKARFKWLTSFAAVSLSQRILPRTLPAQHRHNAQNASRPGFSVQTPLAVEKGTRVEIFCYFSAVANEHSITYDHKFLSKCLEKSFSIASLIATSVI
jgi:hypothetical protein